MRRAILVAAAWLAASAAAGARDPVRKPAPEAPAPAAATTRPEPPADIAYGAYQRGLYRTAYREAMARLEKSSNDAAAMTLLGELHNQGLGIRQDPAKAAGWYRLAAQRGDPRSMSTLGMMTIDGRGVPRDPEAGRAWLEKAAALREPTAAYNLALILLSGSDDDVSRAARLLVIAAEGEIADAQHALGVLHSRGQGGAARDATEAARLYLRAARNGSLSGEVEFAIAQYNGDGIPRDENGAARHFRYAAARGNAIAQNRLARIYATGRGLPRNPVEAAAWHMQASVQGLSDPWLDGIVRGLSAAERERAEKLAAARTGRS